MKGHETIIGNEEWLEYYPISELPFIAFIFERLESRVMVFQCECCDKWSGKAAHEAVNLLLPFSDPDKEKVLTWIKDNGFVIVGEYVDGYPLTLN